ncbi:hypothetical protein IB292_02385 [Vibrio parahaemolyticus]|uniref:Uncharacterized protein n=1 Tax=Vibrio parahaemolyticus TaxID=670 RepID=A0A9Q3YHT3_VIBPH|nr:hypothetical protein [Vibrio parahaemolyticus]MCC3803877.1 hypothetical protein [Vibrio parahaemolyticus]
MRTPIISTDLSTPFNSVAKYLGRHWPDGKLKHNQSRELLARLMGYNSTHEVYRTADSNTLPDSVSLDKVKKAMFVRGLKFTNSNPLDLTGLLNKLPFRHLAFYQSTAEHKMEQLKTDFKQAGKMLIEDEFHSVMSYTSPDLLCELFDQNLIPRYRQAVRQTEQGYEVFSQSRLEQLARTFEGLPGDVMTEQGIDKSSIINDHLVPNIWCSLEQHIHKMIVNDEWDMPRGFSVFTAHMDASNESEPVYLIGKGVYGALVPRIYKTKGEVYEGIATLLKGNPIKPQTERLPTLYNVRHMFNPKQSKNALPRCGFTMYESYQDSHRFTIHGQQYINYDPIKPYPKGWQQAIDFEPDPKLANIELLKPIADIIPIAVAQDCVQIERKVLPYQRRNEYRMDQLTESQWCLLIKAGRAGDLTFGSSELATLKDEDLTQEDYRLIGRSVESHHPELEGVFDHDVLGVIFESSEANYYGRYRSFDNEPSLCIERNTRFLIAVSAGLLTGNVKFYDDPHAYTAACHVLAAWIFNVDWNFKYEWSEGARMFLADNIKLFRETVIIHQNIDSFLKALLMHEGSIAEKNTLYTYHSEVAEPKRQSDQNNFLSSLIKHRKVPTSVMYYQQTIEEIQKKSAD